jgi:leader peptidase (prepilin peptidase)/N-methyltransferase
MVGSLGRVSGRLQPRQAFAFGPFIALGIWMVWLRGADWWWEQWQRLLGF